MLIQTLFFVLLCFPSVWACGCYGPTSCSTTGSSCLDLNPPPSNCICDCCPGCATCTQINNGCYTSHIISGVVSFAIPSAFSVGTFYSIDLQSSGPQPEYLSGVSGGAPCITPPLPTGLVLEFSNNSWIITGTPTSVSGPTQTEIVFFWTANTYYSTNFTVQVVNGPLAAPGGSCGPGSGGYVCPNDECCSQWGYCGFGNLYCGSGCQNGYGTGSCSNPVVGNLPVTQLGGSCGEAAGYRCPSPECCSQWGYCGTTSLHCGAGCEGSYGECD